MSVPVAPSELNRQRLKALLDFYGVETVEELNAKDDPEYWKEKQWDSWRWNLREWGCYCQTFDMTQPKDGIYPLIDHYSGVRGFSRDETGEVYHEKRYQKATGEEHRRYALPKSENLLDDGMACLPEGPMAANLRLFAFPPTGKFMYQIF
ncbi:hypothetical protein SERLA73DRAFT_142854 [Serpula lacrymans var. lacrymans S7.3]|uniref:Uncharacterized protein n=1 Tax=Serpula lacrymans var. lacrymans (strain S7.3) TaxID=936435 RepID=F8Q8I6_SERL3|nr:hypothetical protein SERLA73DRAFT_142854 [Serpula lacrymans var. lacrymans S7.3]